MTSEGFKGNVIRSFMSFFRKNSPINTKAPKKKPIKPVIIINSATNKGSIFFKE
jgi:hypothetical protein